MTRQQTWIKRGHIAGIAVALIAYVLALIAFAPAALLDAGLQRATDGKLRLAQAQGTLWSGAGRIEIRDPGGRDGVGKDVSWTLHSRALWRGRLDFDVAIDQAIEHFPVRISPRMIEVSDLDLSLPASALGLAIPRMAALGPQGNLAVRVATFALARNRVSIDAVATWTDAHSALTSVAPLGSYELRLDDAAGSLKASLRTLSGPLQLDGGGSWGGSNARPFSATARVDAPHHAQLAPLLRLISVERSDGVFVLQFSSPLSTGSH